MASRFEKYRVRRGDDIGDPEYLSGRFRDVDSRLVAVEDQKETLDAVIEEGREVFRTRVDEILVPLIAEVEAVAELGALLRAHSTSEIEVTTGGKTLFVDEEDRLRFAAPAYLSIMAMGNPALALSGALVSYSATTGELVVNVDQVEGAGYGADWMISVGNTTDALADATLAANAAAEALGYKTQVESLTLLASGAADVAVTRADQAVAANGQAQTAKAQALASATNAATAASTAVGYLSGFLGSHAAAPSTRADGSTLQPGDWYFRTVSGPPVRYYIDYWDGTGWRSLTAAADTSVTSWNGRTGGVIPASGDYNTSLVTRSAGGGVSATTAEDAITELATAIASEATTRASAITGRVSTMTTVTGGGIATGGGALSSNQVITVTKSTSAQAVAGTDDTTAMTPVRVKDAIGALVPAASTTASGKSRLATTTEATTGTAVDIAVTPAGLKAATDAVKSALLNGAGTAFDTLSELAAALGNDANFSATVSGQIAAKLNITATSSWARGGLINAVDQASARSYLGLASAALQAASAFAAAVHVHAISDVTGLQTALDAKLAASGYTASDVLTKIKSVDGNGSGLDADLLRGQTPTTFGLSRLIDADAATARSGLGLTYATTAQMQTGVATGVVADPAGVAAAIRAQAGGYLLRFASDPFAVVLASTTTLTHGLGAMPDWIQLRARCVTAEYGYAVGDEVDLSNIDTNASNRGIVTIVTSTQIKVTVGNGGVVALNASTGVAATITAANWNLIVRAFRWAG